MVLQVIGGCNKDLNDAAGQTALSIATEKGLEDIVNFLTEAGASAEGLDAALV